MPKYKDKLCVICGCIYKPYSPNQKSCNSKKCKAEIRRKSERRRYKNNVKVYSVVCLSCGVRFSTTDSRRKYCGSVKCEKNRKKINNRRKEVGRRGQRVEEKKEYYLNNSESIKGKKKKYYRDVLHPNRDVRDGWSTEKLTYAFVKQFIEKNKYSLLSKEYINTHTKLDLLCPKGHFWSTSFHNFKDCGNECPTCVYKRIKSKPEEEIYDFVCSIISSENVLDNIRSIIPPYELDIYVPSKNLAIEYCGLYWHSEISGGKDRRYHYNKMKLCNDLGIRLITIFEDEYRDRPLAVKSRIQNALGIGLNRIYARKCDIREISYLVSSVFLAENHLQGKSGARKRWGLFYEEELVSVMSVGTPSRNHTGKLKGSPEAKVLELKRFCSKTSTNVVGGVSKLFKRVVKYAEQNKYTHIKSYCDLRYANNFKSVYEILGMEILTKTKYTPYYIKDGNRFRNQGLRKTKKEKMTDLSEWEMRKSQGYDRLWDVGHITYIYVI